MKGRDLKRRLAQKGASQADLAAFMTQQLGYDVTVKGVSRIVTGERKKLGVEEAAAIEGFFEGDYFPVPAPERGPAGRIPLYGMAAAGTFDGVAYNSDAVLDWIEAPVRNVDAAFRVAGSSMEPRLFAGETVYVKLGVPPKRGDDAVVEMKGEGQGVLIKSFSQIKDGFVFLHQWNPASEIKLRYDDVRALHAVRLRA